jgi:hypothetical protein
MFNIYESKTLSGFIILSSWCCHLNACTLYFQIFNIILIIYWNPSMEVGFTYIEHVWSPGLGEGGIAYPCFFLSLIFMIDVWMFSTSIYFFNHNPCKLNNVHICNNTYYCICTHELVKWYEWSSRNWTVAKWLFLKYQTHSLVLCNQVQGKKVTLYHRRKWCISWYPLNHLNCTKQINYIFSLIWTKSRLRFIKNLEAINTKNFSPKFRSSP